MTELSFNYHLNIDFDAPVHNHNFALRCCPQTDERQQIDDMKFNLLPQESLWFMEDNFGNRYAAGSIKKQHSHFEVDVRGTARVGLSDSTAEVNKYRENIFKYQTALTKPDRAVLDAVSEIIRTNGQKISEDPIDMAAGIMAYLSENMIYTPGSTAVDTTAAEAFAMKQGVCQDYAHIMLSMLRSRGICSRYVVGMLPGEGLSHAWVEVKSDGRWYGFDPTNNVRVTDHHIKMSHGRDYKDCMINIGCLAGRAQQYQSIYVSVKDVAK